MSDEIMDTTESTEEERSSDLGFLPDPDDLVKAQEISRRTPTNEELLKTAKLFPPPPEWLEGEEERPF